MADGASTTRERTFIMVKPDGVQRRLISTVIERFSNKGYKLVAAKLARPPREHIEKHYEDLKDKPFFGGLVEYMTSGPVFAMVWEGEGVIAGGRKLLGATKPSDSAPGTLRGDYCIDVGRNLVHGSDGLESSAKEQALWFNESEICSYTSADEAWVYE